MTSLFFFIYLQHKPVPATSHPEKLHEETALTKDFPLYLSSSLSFEYPANCPNPLAGYIHINPNDLFKQDCILSCTSLYTAFYYVHDGPLLKYLPVILSNKAFSITVFRDQVSKDKVESIR
ncbi:hypothetical protein I4U23_007722 [Adineta vaga]|nr:hypothetical protein I4U23_007722 [Adineta vaga]